MKLVSSFVLAAAVSAISFQTSPDRLDYRFFGPIEGDTPHVPLNLQFQVHPKEGHVTFRWGYYEDGRLRRNTLKEATSFRPTAIAQMSETTFLVAGKDRESHELVLEEWFIRHPQSMPQSYTLDTGEKIYPPYDVKVNARTSLWSQATSEHEAIQALFFLRGGSERNALVKMFDSDDLHSFDLDTGQMSLVYDGNDPQHVDHVQALTLPWDTCIALEHATKGNLYGFLRVERGSTDSRMALLFRDSDKDGDIDSWAEFSVGSTYQQYLGHAQGQILKLYR